jgi:hypothetical protein
MRRRSVMVASDLGRAALLATVPLAALAGQLGMAHLYVVAFLVGTLTVLYDVANRAYLPTLVAREQIAGANGRLELTRAVTAIVGPGVAGALLSVMAAPLAVAVDAASFLLSGGLAGSIRRPEPAPASAHRSVAVEMREGLSFLFGSPILRALAAGSGLLNLFSNVVLAVLVLYLAEAVGLGAGGIGAVFAAAGLGGVAGALGVQPAAWRLGLGPTIVATLCISAAGGLLVSAAAGIAALTLPLLLAGALLFGMGTTAWNVVAVSLRQAITPTRVQGRVAGAQQFVAWGAMPVGSLLGGLLGELAGLPTTVAIGGAGTLAAVLPLLFSPLPRLRTMPAAAE